jgi:hypothetical protein
MKRFWAVSPSKKNCPTYIMTTLESSAGRLI